MTETSPRKEILHELPFHLLLLLLSSFIIKMKIVALVSGGKDSIYAIHCATRQMHHELVACIHLAPSSDEETEESYMYQSAASNIVRTQVEECLQVPCLVQTRTGRSVQTGLFYHHGSTENNTVAESHLRDEVEDLYDALRGAQQQFPDLQGVCCGAILSNYQRLRVESVCQRLSLTSLAPLWRQSRPMTLLADLLRQMSHVVLVKTAAPPGLLPQRHLQQLSLHEIDWPQLQQRYRLQVCGEGGEYETLVLDAALFRRRLVLDEVEIRLDPDDASIGTLEIVRYHTEEKEGNPEESADDTAVDTQQLALPPVVKPCVVDAPPSLPLSSDPSFIARPHVRKVSGGLYSISELMDHHHNRALEVSSSSSSSDASTPVIRAAQSIFRLLHHVLESLHCTAQDVLLVHVFLCDISHFAVINAQYAQFFGTILPPSRCTVGLGDPNHPLVLDCLVQAGSGAYLRGDTNSSNPYTRASLGNPTFSLRQVLHVQSISYWAPVCIGPYSQAQTLRSAVHWVSGQIGLDPPTMQLRKTPDQQLRQSLRNVAQILDALDATSCAFLLSSLLWVADSVGPRSADEWRQLKDQCRELLVTNGGVVPGWVEGLNLGKEDSDEYEDEETRLADAANRPPRTEEIQRMIPILVAAIPQLPMGAAYEMEVVAASRRVAQCMPILDHSSQREMSDRSETTTMHRGWDTGHDFTWPRELPHPGAMLELHAHLCRLGSRATTCAVVAARSRTTIVDPGHILQAMLRTVLHLPEFDVENMLHLRLYYIRTMVDGSYLRPLWQSALAAVIPTSDLWPATTVIPVTALALLEEAPFTECCFAMQVLCLDPVRTEQSMWIHREP
jgi:diphthine-ammonia ligase